MFKKRYIGLLIVCILTACLFLIWSHLGAETVEGAACPKLSPPPDITEPSDPPPNIQEEAFEAPDPEVVYIEPEDDEIPLLQRLIQDLRDDDIRGNARRAMYKLSSKLPGDEATVELLIETLGSDDLQQRQIAGYILSRWATNTDLSSNRQFVGVLLETLVHRKPLAEMYLSDTAEDFFFKQDHSLVNLLQPFLLSDNAHQQTVAAFILAVSLHIPAESRERMKDILSAPSNGFLPDSYRRGAWTLCAASGESWRSDPSEMVEDLVYVVRRGDILGRIASEYNTSWRILAMYNFLKNPDLIEPGIKIFIPGTLRQLAWSSPSYFSVSNDDSSELPVRDCILYPSETLEDVAKQYDCTVEEIMILNNFSDPNAVKPGTRFMVLRK